MKNNWNFEVTGLVTINVLYSIGGLVSYFTDKQYMIYMPLGYVISLIIFACTVFYLDFIKKRIPRRRVNYKKSVLEKTTVKIMLQLAQTPNYVHWCISGNISNAKYLISMVDNIVENLNIYFVCANPECVQDLFPEEKYAHVKLINVIGALSIIKDLKDDHKPIVFLLASTHYDGYTLKTTQPTVFSSLQPLSFNNARNFVYRGLRNSSTVQLTNLSDFSNKDYTLEDLIKELEAL